ncbi:bifunctional methylenetetrahydrofolate dehydrogenase/methenyltetrahydrofolate cyclohydrolase FolD [Litorivita pollutaquae]|uniref:Bifunctional protein FolD n=1 Tax=Litorivita pollutaquae TaxID=2200892 RepID=A0A2V4NTE1_9RHOB|nr:bifunctional methylenetetrahydrofolate dehydrogenase/methenyltetrahydrofolate cyclohydrolase FolD [Litorivita pollutaquae]PYC48156.1 bifunctional methylenetetrahydrofolate dehydrogenase/methenyltetrahydrofolate cyclohydrolase FolD [Litorivita pollutaquae]
MTTTPHRTAHKIDGKAYAAALRETIATHVAWLKEVHGVTPGLAVLLVGEDPASQVYVRNKGVQTVEVGMNSYEHKLPADVSAADLYALIDRLNADPAVHGILCQFPVPEHLSETEIVARIDPAKDVDGLSVVNAGLLASGQKAMVSCTPLGCLMLLRDHLGSLSGKSAVVIGRSNLVGKPVAQLLLRDSCTVTIAHSRTANLEEVVRGADIVVAAVGRPQMVKGSWLKPGATVIDVGINRIPAPERGAGKNRLVGDVDYDSAAQVAGAISPVPGGVGPMTIACLLANTVTACCRSNGLAEPEGLSV